jgi:tRNA(Leu) C34 or U34 (ribose-2'-O)-methylase TrmL
VSASVLLLGPAYAHNVGNALRACAVLGARELLWTGDRVPAPEDWPTGARLPREERMALYRHVEITHHGSWSKVRARFAAMPYVVVWKPVYVGMLAGAAAAGLSVGFLLGLLAGLSA